MSNHDIRMGIVFLIFEIVYFTFGILLTRDNRIKYTCEPITDEDREIRNHWISWVSHYDRTGYENIYDFFKDALCTGGILRIAKNAESNAKWAKYTSIIVLTIEKHALLKSFGLYFESNVLSTILSSLIIVEPIIISIVSTCVSKEIFAFKTTLRGVSYDYSQRDFEKHMKNVEEDIYRHINETNGRQIGYIQGVLWFTVVFIIGFMAL